MPTVTWPADNYPITLEVALGADLSASPATWTWTPIPADDIRNEISIQVGRPDARAQVEPTRLTFTLKNTSGKYTPRNPLSPLWPNWGRDTPVRVSRAGSVRGTVFVTDLRQRWPADNSTVSEIEVTASGILRYLAQGDKLEASATRRAFLATNPVDYWPGEDESAANAGASGLPNRGFLRYYGSMTFGAAPVAASSRSIQLSTDSRPEGVVGKYATSTSWTVGMIVNIATPVAGVTELMAWSTSNTLVLWRLILTPGAPDTLGITAYTPAGVTLFTDTVNFTAGTISEPYGRDLLVVVTATQSGGNISYNAIVRTKDQQTSNTGTQAGTNGQVTGITIPPNTSLSGTRFGHMAVWGRVLSGTEITNLAALLEGYNGETASARMIRIASEIGSSLVNYSTASTKLMGAQTIQTGLTLIQAAAAVGGGLVYEARDAATTNNWLIYRDVADIYSQTSPWALDHNAGDLAPSLEPAEDDQEAVNQYTASREGGSSYVYELTSGFGSTANGRVYDSSGSFNVYSDSQLPDIAAWKVHMGTIDSQRYPNVSINLFANPHLVADWLNQNIGNRITVTGGLDQLPPGGLDLVLQGYQETMDPRLWFVRLNCTVYRPWEAAVLDNAASAKLDTAGCWINTAAAASATTLTVSTTLGPKWTEDGAQPPFDIIVGGEVMRVTNVAASSFAMAGTPQTTSSGNTGGNSTLSLAMPAGAVGDALIVLVAARDGVAVTPTGWNTLVDGGNWKLIHKAATLASEPNVTLTFTGTPANASLIAQSMRHSGLSNVPGKTVDASAVQANASAQDILTPEVIKRTYDGDRYLGMVIGYKKDDWTSVANSFGGTEIGEPSTTAGDDIGIYWTRFSMPDPGTIAPQTLTVTGGAAAVSGGMAARLFAQVQVLTVTRGINGITKAHDIGAEVKLYKPLTLAY